MSPEVCPNCGAELPPNARVCPECGSDDETGWSATAREQDLGLADENFDYNEFVKREFEAQGTARRGVHWFWWVAAIGVLAGLVVLGLR